MKVLGDFLPVVLFLIAYKTLGLMEATAVLMGVTSIQMLIVWVKHRKLEKSQLLTLAAVLILGGATLLFRNENIIKWKPTVVYWLMAVAFIGGRFFGDRKPITERMLGKSLELSPRIWRLLDNSWTIFFILTGALNLLIAFSFDTDTWVNFKLFGLLGLTLLFALVQGVVISRFAKPTEKQSQQEEVRP
jgi:intracellular septation protein